MLLCYKNYFCCSSLPLHTTKYPPPISVFSFLKEILRIFKNCFVGASNESYLNIYIFTNLSFVPQICYTVLIIYHVWKIKFFVDWCQLNYWSLPQTVISKYHELLSFTTSSNLKLVVIIFFIVRSYILGVKKYFPRFGG